MPKITKRTVDALRPDPERDVFAWDSELRGFGIRTKPSGTKSYLVQYRNTHGRTRRLVIGSVGALTPDEARKLAKSRLAEVEQGEDPSADRRAAREAMTVAAVCDWYLKEAGVGRILGRRNRPIKASTLALDKSRIAQHVKPLIGSRATPGLTVADLEKMQADIAAGKTKKARKGRGGTTSGGAAVAGRTLAMLSTIFEHAVRSRVIPANPAKGTRKMKAKRRLARLSLEQISALGRAMRDGEGENPTGLAAIRLISLTGFRRHEALGIKKAWVLDAGGVMFPDTKSDAQVRPVGKAAMELLKRQKQIVGDETEWLFPADRGDGHFVGVRKVLGRVASKAGLPCTPHLLRHTFSSVAGDLGYSELTIAGLLGHSSRGVTQGYVHLDQALVAAADRVAAVIAVALDGKPSAAVVDIRHHSRV